MNVKEFIYKNLIDQYKDIDKRELLLEIDELVDKGNYLILGDLDGFITWLEVRKKDKLYIYINNGLIKRKLNLIKFRKFFRHRYPNAEFFYYHKMKNNKFVYGK